MKARLEAFGRLLEIKGVGVVMAAVLVGETISTARFSSEGRFAGYAGVAPVEHSSGTSKRVRVNRRGNRRLNKALETITLSRTRWDEETRAYLERKRSEGMGKRQAFRATKRVVCRMVFRVLCQVLT